MSLALHIAAAWITASILLAALIARAARHRHQRHRPTQPRHTKEEPMADSQQTRPTTPEEDIKELYSRTAKLNDIASALLAPAWGSKTGIIPADHPLYVAEKPAAAQQEQSAPVDWQAIAKQREHELKAVGEQKHAAEQERDGAYRERAQLLAWLATLHQEHAVIAPSIDVDEAGWQLLFLTVAGRQLSWHIAPRDADLFEHVEHVEWSDPRAAWDGHTTDEKYQRIAELSRR